MTSENCASNAAEESRRGDEAMRAAKTLLEVALFNDVVSRAYYGAYHWARALLLTKGMESKTHNGLIRLIGREFVSKGALPKDAATLLAQLESDRGTSDYTASARFTRKQAEETIARAEEFIGYCHSKP